MLDKSTHQLITELYELTEESTSQATNKALLDHKKWKHVLNLNEIDSLNECYRKFQFSEAALMLESSFSQHSKLELWEQFLLFEEEKKKGILGKAWDKVKSSLSQSSKKKKDAQRNAEVSQQSSEDFKEKDKSEDEDEGEEGCDNEELRTKLTSVLSKFKFKADSGSKVVEKMIRDLNSTESKFFVIDDLRKALNAKRKKPLKASTVAAFADAIADCYEFGSEEAAETKKTKMPGKLPTAASWQKDEKEKAANKTPKRDDTQVNVLGKKVKSPFQGPNLNPSEWNYASDLIEPLLAGKTSEQQQAIKQISIDLLRRLARKKALYEASSINVENPNKFVPYEHPLWDELLKIVQSHLKGDQNLKNLFAGQGAGLLQRFLKTINDAGKLVPPDLIEENKKLERWLLLAGVSAE